MSSKQRQKYKIVGPATWELVRAAYLAGESATVLAERYGVGIHGIRKRISKEQWTKRDYAVALEARGLKPPPRANAAVNVAERFAAAQAPAEKAPAPAHPFMELVGALKEATAAAEAQRAASSEGEPALEKAEAAELEQRALGSLAAALSKGRASEARALVSVADSMRKRVVDEEAQAAAVVEAVVREKGARERELIHRFQYAALLAYCCVHNPKGAPAIFVDLIAEGRKALFDEGDEESLERAACNAADSRRYFNMDEEEWQNALAEHNARRKAHWAAVDAARAEA